jgi:hypothetical protein
MRCLWATRFLMDWMERVGARSTPQLAETSNRAAWNGGKLARYLLARLHGLPVDHWNWNKVNWSPPTRWAPNRRGWFEVDLADNPHANHRDSCLACPVARS